MKVVIAMDSFKGSLSSLKAGQAAAAGIRKVFEKAEIIVRPLADGGEGTVRALTEGLDGTPVTVTVLDPLGRNTQANYGISGDTAIMEMAEASGITKLDPQELNPWKADTFGTGQMIQDALDKGIRKFILGIGGSATSEGGSGMLRALGARFLDKEGKELEPGFENLKKLEKIDLQDLDPRLKDSTFLIACDVNNPLPGKQGAIAVFGPQKGIRNEEVEEMDAIMDHYADIVSETTGKDLRNQAGAGAAGGLGFALLSFFPHIKLQSGISLILDYLNFRDVLKGCDVLVTGEGRLDEQSAMGKVPIGIAKLAKEVADAKTIAFAGSVSENAGLCNQEGIDAFFPIVRGVCTLKEAMDPNRAAKNLEQAAEQAFRLLR